MDVNQIYGILDKVSSNSKIIYETINKKRCFIHPEIKEGRGAIILSEIKSDEKIKASPEKLKKQIYEIDSDLDVIFETLEGRIGYIRRFKIEKDELIFCEWREDPKLSTFGPNILIKKHEIITILGSTKFQKEIENHAYSLTLEGKLVFFAPFRKESRENLENHRNLLESIHFQKIRMSNKIIVFNRNGYIGDSTKLEIEYSEHLKKPIQYLEKGAKQ
jgi:hypothetical protein